MEIIQDNLSSLTSPDMTSNLLGVDFKQIRRTYPGNVSFNFPICLSGSNDFKVKNYTNFYLTKKWKLSDFLTTDNSKTLTKKITSSIKFGNYKLYCDLANTEYGIAAFDDISDHPPLTLEFFDNNLCRIYHTEGLVKYYLYYDSNGSVLFIKGQYLSFNESTVNPQDFTYVYSEDDNNFILFKNTQTETFFITNENKVMVAVPLHESGLVSYTVKSLKLDRGIYMDPSQKLDGCFVTYDSENKVNSDKSYFNITNNCLLSKKYSTPDSDTDILVLKNQLLQNDVFSSANNLLSGEGIKTYVNDLREYTSIFNDIPQETCNDLELNYVFYNKTYAMKPGVNTFTSPSSMYPFTRLNINDAKFISSGSFSNSSPLYADKVYLVSDKVQNSTNGQYLLCTWLSGSPFSENKIWMDRYYYPDLIEKEEAISSVDSLVGTYDDYLESILQSNQDLKTSVSTRKFFDKKSDFVFEPDKTYTYERIFKESPTTSKNYCDDFMTNYFEDINSSGQMTFAYYFGNEGTNWTVFSDRNAIDSGLKIIKNGNTLSMEYKIYDVSVKKYEIFDTSVTIPPNHNGIVVFSIDTKKGNGYFMFNNEQVLQFSLSPYQYTTKHLLYNNFFINVNGETTDLLLYTKETGNAYITSEYTSPDAVFSIPLLFQNLNIDTIYLTLPCGMRNGSDNIQFLQSTCGSSIFKSNNINIYVKNLNIDNENILNGVKDSITTSLKSFVPANAKINNIVFQNFK